MLPARSRDPAGAARPRASGLLVTGIAVALAIAGCGSPSGSPGPTGPSPEPDALRVVTTTTVLADMVAQVGGTKVDVVSLVPKGGEVHTFDPTPSDVRKIVEADVVLANGLGLDTWLAALAADAGTSAPVVRLAEDLPGVVYLRGTDGEGDLNPHLWLDVAYAARYADRIGEVLATADPSDAAAYAAGASAYRLRLEGLDSWARAQLANVPEANRTVVSFHEAFPYFAAAYGLTIVGTITDAPGQDPSAGEIAALVAAIRDYGVSAIFAEAQFSDDLVRTIAGETGARIVTSLYNDSLGDPPVDTYEGLMRWNVDRVVEALTGS